jgi:hypothetical protein
MEWMNIDKDINPLQESDYQLTEDIFPHENQSNNIDWDNFLNSKSSLSIFDESSEIISLNNSDTKSTSIQNKKNLSLNNNNNIINNSTLISTNSKNEKNEINSNFNCDNKIKISYEDIPLKERMRIKKEKTKKILERKTKRNEENNNLNFQIPLKENIEKEELNKEKEEAKRLKEEEKAKALAEKEKNRQEREKKNTPQYKLGKKVVNKTTDKLLNRIINKVLKGLFK